MIIEEKYRWPTTIPYYLEDSLGETVSLQHITLIPVVIFIPFFALCCVLCRHECKGSDPEGVRPVQTEDLHRLHTLERRRELHLCVQRQRVR